MPMRVDAPSSSERTDFARSSAAATVAAFSFSAYGGLVVAKISVSMPSAPRTASRAASTASPPPALVGRSSLPLADRGDQVRVRQPECRDRAAGAGGLDASAGSAIRAGESDMVEPFDVPAFLRRQEG